MTGVTVGGLARSGRLKPGESRALACAFLLLLVMLGMTALNAIFGVGGRAAEAPVRNWISSAIYIVVAAIVAFRAIRVPAKRRSWAVFALGLSFYALGNVLWSFWIGNLHNPPFPSVCDALWLTLYPLSYAGIVGFARLRGQRTVPAGVWLDGLIAGAGLARSAARSCSNPSRPRRRAARPLSRRSWPIRSATFCSPL